jgi:hypothetical protein
MCPTQVELQFRSTAGGQTQNDRLRAIFLKRPGQWLPMTDLGREIGAWAVHSRVADLRSKYGMKIKTLISVDPFTGQRHSAYRYVPNAPGERPLADSDARRS